MFNFRKSNTIYETPSAPTCYPCAVVVPRLGLAHRRERRLHCPSETTTRFYVTFGQIQNVVLDLGTSFEFSVKCRIHTLYVYSHLCLLTVF